MLLLLLMLLTTCETNNQARTVCSVQRVVKRADTVYIAVCNMHAALCPETKPITRLNGYISTDLGEQDQVIYLFAENVALGRFWL